MEIMPTAKSTCANKFIWSSPRAPYLMDLRKKYELDKVCGAKNDYEAAVALCEWVCSRLDHSAVGVPKKGDPISILEEAEKGKTFKCTEYAIVLHGCLAAVGIKARIVGLMAEDVETRKDAAGHVVVEAYTQKFNKWMMLDATANTVPTKSGRPLNLIETRTALSIRDPRLKFINIPKKSLEVKYGKWLLQYLFYLRMWYDNRVYAENKDTKSIILGPLGYKKPVIFERKWPIDNALYTTSITTFYRAPTN